MAMSVTANYCHAKHEIVLTIVTLTEMAAFRIRVSARIQRTLSLVQEHVILRTLTSHKVSMIVVAPIPVDVVYRELQGQMLP